MQHLALGRRPFRSVDMAVLVQQIVRGRFDMPDTLSTAAEGIIRGLLAPAEKRLGTPPNGSASIKSAAFFDGLDFGALYRKEVAAPLIPSQGKGVAAPGGTAQMATLKARHQGGIELLQREFTSWAAEKDDSFHLSRSTSHGDLSSIDRGMPADLDELASASSAALSLELALDGTICGISPQLMRLLGYPRIQQYDLLGRSMLDKASTMVHPDDLVRFAAAFAEAAEGFTAGGESSSAVLLADCKGRQLEERLSQSPVMARPAMLERLSLGLDRVVESDAETTSILSTSEPLAFEPVIISAPERFCPPDRPASRASSVASDTSFTMPKSRRQSHDVHEDMSAAPPPSVEVTIRFTRNPSLANLRAPMPLDPLACAPESPVPTARAATSRPLGPVFVKCAIERIPGHSPSISVFEAAQHGWVPAQMRAFRVTMVDVTEAEESKALVRRRYESSYNAKKSDNTVGTLFSSEMVFNSAGTQLPMSAPAQGSTRSGIEKYLERRRLLCRAFPDIHFRLLEQTCKSDGPVQRVFTSWQWLGTHLGRYQSTRYDGTYEDLPPSGKRVHVHGIAVDVVGTEEAGAKRILDHAAFFDEAALRMQLTGMGNLHKGRDAIRARATAKAARREEATRGVSRVHLYLTVHGAHAAELVHLDDGADGGEDEGAQSGLTVGATVRTAMTVSTKTHEALRDEEIWNFERESLVAMGDFYSSKSIRQLADCKGDGFALCAADAKKRSQLMLLSTAFAAVVGVPGKKLLGMSLVDLVRKMTPNAPEIASTLAEKIDRGEKSVRLVFAARRPPAATSSPPRGNGSSDGGERCVVVLHLSGFEIDRRAYYAVLLSDMTYDPSRASSIEAPSLKVGSAKAAADKDGVELSAKFFERVPRSWTWFNCKQLKTVLARAMDSLEVGLSLSDLMAEDCPLVWFSQGFTRINGYSREDAIGHNCRFLQCDASDPNAILRLRRAVERGEHARVQIWNEGMAAGGYWSFISLHPTSEEVRSPPGSVGGSTLASKAPSRRMSREGRLSREGRRSRDSGEMVGSSSDASVDTNDSQEVTMPTGGVPNIIANASPILGARRPVAACRRSHEAPSAESQPRTRQLPRLLSFEAATEKARYILGVQMRLTHAEVQQIALLADEQQSSACHMPPPLALPVASERPQVQLHSTPPLTPSKAPESRDEMTEALTTWCELYRRQHSGEAPTMEAAMAAMSAALGVTR